MNYVTADISFLLLQILSATAERVTSLQMLRICGVNELLTHGLEPRFRVALSQQLVKCKWKDVAVTCGHIVMTSVQQLLLGLLSVGYSALVSSFKTVLVALPL